MVKNVSERVEGPSAWCVRTHVQKKKKLATLKSSARFNMHQLREEHDEALNATKHNGTTETIE